MGSAFILEIEAYRKAMTEKRSSKKLDLSIGNLLSTGSTLLNLATAGNPFGGLAKGGYYFFVGDSSSGKTFLTLTCFAEAAKSKSFAKHRLIYDDVEGGALMDFEKFFGKEVADRIEPPAGTREDPEYSETIEQFYFNCDECFKEPCIYVLDSMDCLTSDAEDKKFKEKKKAASKGTEVSGDYGDGKAKTNSRYLRTVLRNLRATGSILIIISQTRDNVGGGMFEPQKIRSGGHALKFYAHLEIWSSLGKLRKKSIRGKERDIGITSRLKIKKNRLSGRLSTIEVPIYYDYGLDDLSSCIEYLVSEGEWKKKGPVIAGSLVDEEFSMSLRKLIAHIEKNSLEKEIQTLVSEVWHDILDQTNQGRKKRY